ncbi:hypothetical protein [Actinomycetia phage DSL-LC01]|nr:hypothetical protein [Actinomycetia phage DSL-LC01]
MSSKKEIVVATQAEGAVKVIFTGNDSSGLPRGSIVTEASDGTRIVLGRDILLHSLLSHQQDENEWNILLGFDELQEKRKLETTVPKKKKPLVSTASALTSASGPCWEGYVQVGMKEKDGKMVPNCVPKDAAVTEFAKAPKKDRIYGSKKNPKGSASGGKKITFSAKTEAALRNKMQEHNEKAPKGRKTTMGQLKAVYRRGAGAYSSSHRPGKTRDQWAMARVNAYLRLLRSGRPANPNYKQDNDLLPKAHPKSSKTAAITAGATVIDDLTVVLHETMEEYVSPEHALVACAEYSGLGYESVPSFRAAWLRAVENGEEPYERVKELALQLYSSRDADLLPRSSQKSEK